MGGMEEIPLGTTSTNTSRLRRNKTEGGRLQGLVHAMKETKEGENGDGGVRRTLGRLEKASVWMVNEGKYIQHLYRKWMIKLMIIR